VASLETAGKSRSKKRTSTHRNANTPTASAAGDTVGAGISSSVETDAELVSALKSWRLDEARKRQVPAFHILSNRVLEAIAAAQPTDENTLLSVKGVGPTIAEKYGEKILSISKNYQ
jgi:superfamily II DNA helicase RecQ